MQYRSIVLRSVATESFVANRIRVYTNIELPDNTAVETASTQTKSAFADSKKSKFGVECALRTKKIRYSAHNNQV